MKLTITDIQEEVKGVKTFFLKPVDGSELVYKPGQFLTFSINVAGKEQRRSYSFSSTPGVDALPSITVKRIENGLMSRWLIDRANVGDMLWSDAGATGLFTLPANPEDYKAVWLFAGGIGITPLFALLKELLFHTAIQRIVLIDSNKSRDQTVFQSALDSLQNLYPTRLQIVYLWSNTQDLMHARISKESFPILRREFLVDNPEKSLCYICGPTSYMWLLQLLLQDAGVPAASVRREAFVVNKEVPYRLPVDKTPHHVVVISGTKRMSFTNAYPQSILSSARQAGIMLPYSCDAGQCGSCTAICKEGKVWMSYNEVLTEKDLAMGRVLTCTGHAVDGDVLLAFQE